MTDAAALQRAGDRRKASDRYATTRSVPQWRRSAPTPGAPALVTARSQMRAAAADGDRLDFDGMASVYEVPYDMWDWAGPYTEVMSEGSGKKTLSEDPDVAFLLNHGGLTMARTRVSKTLTLTEQVDGDVSGLHVRASLDGRRADVRDMGLALESGDVDQMSFAFTIQRGIWSPDYTEYRISEYNLHCGDVSVVNFGANPNTFGGLRSRAAEMRQLRQVATSLQEGRALSEADAKVVASILGMAASIDLIVDEMPEEVAELLTGVPNPDDEVEEPVEPIADPAARARAEKTRLFLDGLLD